MFWSSDAEGDAVVRLGSWVQVDEVRRGGRSWPGLLPPPQREGDATAGQGSRVLGGDDAISGLFSTRRMLDLPYYLAADAISPIEQHRNSHYPTRNSQHRNIATCGETGNLLARWPGSNKCLVISMAGVNAKKAHVTMIEWPSLGFYYPIFAKEKLQRLQRRPSPGGVNMRAGERVSSVHPDGVVSHTGQL
ncbi:hypothetical protein BN1708_015362 [Verticillium longisporum]|uniref:Uncharacterized protein n=1 Tax=Verticillium longisporum TaxID=100787 RepID=A0A0G4M3M5_VERLO|nr:hypothetical protein BN1708_015362 [Verticillium longisporum]